MSELKFTVTYGKTVNLGNYESARIDLSYEFRRDEMDPEEAFLLVKTKVDYWEKELKEARGIA